MSAVTLFYLLFFLVVGIWTVAVIGFWYGQKLLKKQAALVADLMPFLNQVRKERETVRLLEISDKTPLSKLENINLPDNVQVGFKHHSDQE